MKWEYCFVDSNVYLNGQPVGINADILNLYGQNGWEAVCMEKGLVLVKRPIPIIIIEEPLTTPGTVGPLMIPIAPLKEQ